MDKLLEQVLEDHGLCCQFDILGELADQFFDDEPWDDLLAQQELEYFDDADENFGLYDEVC